MDQKNEQKAPLRIKNLAELKRCIRPGTELVATSHSKHPALVGLVRVVTEVQTNAYYSVVKDQPTHQYSTCNYGKGFRSDFEKASNYLFGGTTIKVLDRRSGDGSVLYEMELYPGECLIPGQKSDMEENEEIREDGCEIKQEGMSMTLTKVSFSVPYMDEHIPTTGVCVEDANELAWAIEGMQCEDGELLKYLSVLSVEQPGTMQDALRYAMNLDDYVACCGTSIQPVLKLLERQPQINTVLLCLDNDEAGHLASRRMKEQLAERYTVERLIPAHKDWNDDLTAEEPSYAQVMQ